jgi:hypothetical protein
VGALSITIRVPWQDPYNKDFMWNELLAWTCETYGLPGDAWRYHPTEHWMDFAFNDENDALMFQIKTGGVRRYKEDYSVEFVGRLINGQ